jgi:threonine aldolase
MNAVELCDALHERGIWAQDTAIHSVRMVTHWNVNRAGIERAIQELIAVVRKQKGQVA